MKGKMCYRIRVKVLISKQYIRGKKQKKADTCAFRLLIKELRFQI
jgi:hypothetical protein